MPSCKRPYSENRPGMGSNRETRAGFRGGVSEWRQGVAGGTPKAALRRPVVTIVLRGAHTRRAHVSRTRRALSRPFPCVRADPDHRASPSFPVPAAASSMKSASPRKLRAMALAMCVLPAYHIPRLCRTRQGAFNRIVDQGNDFAFRRGDAARFPRVLMGSGGVGVVILGFSSSRRAGLGLLGEGPTPRIQVRLRTSSACALTNSLGWVVGSTSV